MDVIDAMKERRSTRGFLEKPVERETLELLLNLQPIQVRKGCY
jgi:nitroreductase